MTPDTVDTTPIPFVDVHVLSTVGVWFVSCRPVLTNYEATDLWVRYPQATEGLRRIGPQSPGNMKSYPCQLGIQLQFLYFWTLILFFGNFDTRKVVVAYESLRCWWRTHGQDPTRDEFRLPRNLTSEEGTRRWWVVRVDVPRVTQVDGFDTYPP